MSSAAGTLAGKSGAESRIYCAPGRINIIGEHTDYNDGFVLPTTTAAYTWVAATPRGDRIVKVKSLNLHDEQIFGLDNIEREPGSNWSNYVRGVAAILEANGVSLSGTELIIDSEIPIGGGLSSSAALEVAIAIALLDIANASMPPDQIAQLCQRAEIEYAGLNCGIMDQFAVTCCRSGNAMLLDCRDLSARHVQLPESMRFLVTDSGVKHKHPDGEYNRRADECANATELLAEGIPGLKSLRDLNARDLETHKTMLGDLLHRRCRHVVSENSRVQDAVNALESSDPAALGELIHASHLSMRDDFEASCDEVDSLVAIADSCDGVFGSRMIGGGFGGCVLSVVDTNKVEQTMLKISREYTALSGYEPWMHIVTPTDAAKKVELT